MGGTMSDAWRAFDLYKRARLRLLKRVEIIGDCWIWRGIRRGAYGVMTIDGTTRNAHRAAYALFVGPVSEGVSVLHSCGNKLCCCPDHLYLGIQERPLMPGQVAAEMAP